MPVALCRRLAKVVQILCRPAKARYLDSIFIERLWRSPKQERICLFARQSGPQAMSGIGRPITFCNRPRPRADHGGQPPAVVCFTTIKTDQQVQPAACLIRKTVQRPGGATLRFAGCCLSCDGGRWQEGAFAPARGSDSAILARGRAHL
jgi:hypothetical protein